MQKEKIRRWWAKQNKRSLVFGAAALLVMLVVLAYLNTKITVYSDDYWYGTFFDGGFVAFLKEMYRHYRETNGRLYVHLIIPVVLLFDTKLFVVLSPILLALLYGVGAKVLNARLKLENLLLAAALGMLVTLACDVQYLRMTVLWISAYFNYVFPVLMTALCVLFQRRWYEKKQGRTELVFGLIFALLAGASTEQSAIVTLVIVWGYAILNRIWGGVDRKRCWVYPLVVLVGFLTILLAPGSWARVDRGVEGGILSCLIPSVFAKRFYDAMLFVVKYPSSVVMVAVTDALAGAMYLADRQQSRSLLLGFLFAVLQVVAYLLNWTVVACVVYAVSLLTLSVCFLLRKGEWLTGLFLLGSLAANMMLIITTLTFERTAMVSLVTLILVLVSLLLRVCGKLPGRMAVAALIVTVAVCAGALAPTVEGYRESRKIVDANLASIEESKTTGVAYFNIDIDPRYRFTMPFEGTYFYTNFRKYYGMSDDTRLVFTSEKWQLHDLQNADGSLCYFPMLTDENGLLAPFEQVMAAAGGRAVYSWKDHGYDVTLGEKQRHITAEGVVTDGAGAVLGEDFAILLPFSETYTLVYARAEQLERYFDLTLTLDEGRYVVTAP